MAQMEQRRIGELAVSVVGLGCNNFGMTIDAAQTKAVVDAAIDVGINYFDTADVYGGQKSEEFLGRALGSKRDQVIVATKFGHSGMEAPDGRGGSPEWVRTSVEGSLKRLGTDYIDHYQMHVPDEPTPIAETLGALNELVSEGLVREIGCSNFTSVQLDKATAASTENDVARFVSVQNHFSLLTREAETEVIPACQRNDMVFVPYFPLESGVLTGKYATDTPSGSRLQRWSGGMADMFLNDDARAAVADLTEFAESEGHTMLDLALSWLVSNPTVATVIAGATRPDQVVSNAAAATAWDMTTEQRIEAVLIAQR